VKGPVSEVSVEVAARSEIAAIAIDEAALLLGLRPTGRLQLYTRVGKLILEVETRQQIASVALTPDLFIAGSLKTSWWWQTHIGGCRLLGPLLSAGMAVLNHFLLQMYFSNVSQGRKKIGQFFLGFTPSK